MNEFLTSNEPKWRLARTIVQGVLGVIVAALPQILGLAQMDPAVSAIVVAVVMAILSPIMAMLGEKEPEAQ
jgi:multisubunit Na+/H+ antiporter MnhG subunit